MIPIRRATVPSPRASPSYHLFPFPAPPTSISPKRSPSPLSDGQKLHPLQRSATAPASSPARANFDFTDHAQVHVSTKLTTPNSPSNSEDTPVSANDNWNSDLSPTSTEASMIDEIETTQYPDGNKIIIMRLDTDAETSDTASSSAPSPDQVKRVALTDSPIRPRGDFKSHLPAHPAVGRSKPGYATSPRSTRASSLNKPLPSPITIAPIPRKSSLPPKFNYTRSQLPIGASGVRPPNPLQSSPTTAAEISIARQISISRRNQLRTPIMPKTVPKPRRATLVNPDDANAASGARQNGNRTRNGVKMGHVNRKSEHVLVETA